MVEFSVPGVAGGREEFRFSVSGHMVLVAGSRHLEVDGRTCRDLLEGFHLAGFHFFLGCARGVDKSFRKALAESPFREEGFVACAFQSRALRERSLGLYAQLVVPKGLAPAAALRRRTLWMVKRCSLLVLISRLLRQPCSLNYKETEIPSELLYIVPSKIIAPHID